MENNDEHNPAQATRIGSQIGTKTATKRLGLHGNSDRSVLRVSWGTKTSGFGRKKQQTKTSTKAHSSFPKAQPPSRAPS